MNVREKMIEYRTKNGIELSEMSKKTGVSYGILSMVESGYTTHPNIVERIRKGYKLSKREAYELMPDNYNPYGGNYDPDKYKLDDGGTRPFKRSDWKEE